MPTRRELMGFVVAASVSPISFALVDTMQTRLLKLPEAQKRLEYRELDYKAYIAIAISKVDEFIDTHKMELAQLGLIIIAISLILSFGLPPTKELILYLIL